MILQNAILQVSTIIISEFQSLYYKTGASCGPDGLYLNSYERKTNNKI